jgi:hypothetical protein
MKDKDFNAKTQRRKDVKESKVPFFNSLRLCVFALKTNHENAA